MRTTTLKPTKPYPEFPLFPHASGRWAKKVRGSLCYFGSWRDDPQGERAYKLWEERKHDLRAGRIPKSRRTGDLTVDLLVNVFLDEFRKEADAGRKTWKSWRDYVATSKLIKAEFGANTSVAGLDETDFGALLARLKRDRSLVTWGNAVARVKTIFRFAGNTIFRREFSVSPVKHVEFGNEFRKPPKKDLRLARKRKRDAGQRAFAAREVRKLLEHASPAMRAMILLAINCGYGNNDCGQLRERHIDWDAGMIIFPRPKTGIDRKAPLWDETSAALKVAIDKRPRARHPENRDLVFVTKYGNPWVMTHAAKIEAEEDGSEEVVGGGATNDAVGGEFRKLLNSTVVTRNGRSFYSLRRTFRTVADKALDQQATRIIMGHEDESIDESYREFFDDDRLRAVVAHVRGWLFSEGGDQ